MGKIYETIINDFSKGMHNDPRIGDFGYAQLIKNFDSHTYPKKLVPLRDSESGDSASTTSKKQNFCVALGRDVSANSVPYALFGLGVVNGDTKAEILYKKITVREAERLARKIAYDRVRKKEFMPDPEITELEEEFQEKLGTRVHIDRKELGGQIKIDFFSTEDLRTILDLIHKSESEKKPEQMLENFIAKNNSKEEIPTLEETPVDDRTKEDINKDDADLYNISNFSV